MKEQKNFNFDLLEISKYYDLSYNEGCGHLTEWLSAKFELDAFEMRIVNDLFEEISYSGEYMNEEELKAKMVGLVFYVSKVQERKKIDVFYERAMSGVVKDMPLNVICDCLVATPRINAPDVPYFFLQEFKKSKGEKKDPEAQMLIAMLIAQHKNNDNKPIYGGYLLGTGWHFATLIGNDYCISKRMDATEKQNLLQIIYVLKQLKELILIR
jgi:hypothetical protein